MQANTRLIKSNLLGEDGRMNIRAMMLKLNSTRAEQEKPLVVEEQKQQSPMALGFTIESLAREAFLKRKRASSRFNF